MTQRSVRAPAAPSGFAGAVFFAATLAFSGCREADPPAPRVLALGSDTVVLADSIGLVEVRLGRVDEGENVIEPSTVQARVGDVVRFTSADRGGHAIAFDGASLDPAARDFLERTAQMRGPPLLEPGAVWVVNLAGAPPGTYAFTCATHNLRGTLTVGIANR